MTENTTQPKGSFAKSNSASTLSSFKKDVDKKFAIMTDIQTAIVMVLVVAVITMLISVTSIIIDSFRFNSTVYREYADKLEINRFLLESNKQLLEENRSFYKAHKSIQK